MSNQKDDLAGLPTPREGYQWVKETFGVAFQKSKIQVGDVVLYVEPECDGIIEVARQVPTPEPEGPEVIWGPYAYSSFAYEIRPDGLYSAQHPFNTMHPMREPSALQSLATDYASLYAKDKANTALLDSFYELGERAEKWEEWWTNDRLGPDDEPELPMFIMRDLAEAYKEAKGDA